MYCFHDPAIAPADELLVVVHTHTTERWVDRKKQTTGARLRKITSVNVRHGRKAKGVAHFRQDPGNSSFRLVPGNAELARNWRTMKESDVTWTLGADGAFSVPPLDSKSRPRYEAVSKVIAAGEHLCKQAELSGSIRETEKTMRGGEEVEYEVVASLYQLQDRGKVRWGGLRVAGMCIGVDEYDHLDALGNAVRDAEAFNRKLKDAPGCFSIVLRDPSDANHLVRTIRKHLQDSEPPPK